MWQTNLVVLVSVECQAEHVWCVLGGAVGLRPISVLHVLHAKGRAAGITRGGPHYPGRVACLTQQRLQLPYLDQREKDIRSTGQLHRTVKRMGNDDTMPHLHVLLLLFWHEFLKFIILIILLYSTMPILWWRMRYDNRNPKIEICQSVFFFVCFYQGIYLFHICGLFIVQY